MTNLERFIDAFFNAGVALEYLPKIGEGFVVTLQLGAVVIATGLSAGLLLAVVRAFQVRVVNLLIVVFADVMRALPPLVVIILLFFAFPYIDLAMSAFVATWLALSLVLAAFSEEVFWAGIQAVAKGQSEAARSTGMTRFQSLRLVVLPQALRITVAPLTNRVIAITKGTALGSVVALSEILNQASSSSSLAANATPLTLGALAYLALFVPVVALGRWIETRFAWRH